jgi:circadian clock protein KaiB
MAVLNRSRRKYEGGEPALEATQPEYVLKLYIMGTTPSSARAVVNTRNICERYLDNRYQLEIIDLTQNPELAKLEQLIVAPTLIKLLPEPRRRFIGDMSQKERLLAGLEIVEVPDV